MKTSAKRPGILPTKRQVVAELRKEIDAWRTCNQEQDGTIKDGVALHAIRCFEVALQVVKERKFPKGANR